MSLHILSFTAFCIHPVSTISFWMKKKTILTNAFSAKLTKFSFHFSFFFLFRGVTTTPFQHRGCRLPSIFKFCVLQASRNAIICVLHGFCDHGNILFDTKRTSHQHLIGRFPFLVARHAGIAHQHWDTASITLFLSNVPFPFLRAHTTFCVKFTFFARRLLLFLLNHTSIAVRIVRANCLPLIKDKILASPVSTIWVLFQISFDPPL
mmetsp:Transcript_16900/g.26192  ORF Transcript_16900/g.26192 Transcript_16900/m.26192 type:complete len:207 (+) Transcript_16900:222-842(+)